MFQPLKKKIKYTYSARVLLDTESPDLHKLHGHLQEKEGDGTDGRLQRNQKLKNNGQKT
jgi:hypothetical protein